MLWRAPLYFWLLPGVLGVGALLFVLLGRRAAALSAFAEAPLAKRLTPDLDRRRWSWRTMLRVGALILLVVTLAGPKWGFHWQQMKRQGLDLIVAIDTSRSMLATDVKPDRLERAKLAVLDLVPLLEGDRIGLVPFAGTAFLESPLTIDYAAFERAVRSVEVGIIPRGGTALARAIDTSLEGFDAREGKYEALILITDGEDNEGDVTAAAERAKAQGVKIFTVGIGTDEGELLPLGEGGFVKDRGGQVVKSRLDEETLKQIALSTGGAYVHGIGPSLGLDQVFRDHIAPMERREVASALQRQYEERFQVPLVLAIVVLLIEALVPLRRTARAGVRRRRRQAGAAAVTLCLPFLVGFFDPPSDRADEGNQLYSAGKYEEAASKYGEGLIDAPASPLLEFNLATALYKQGKYDEAVKALEQVEASGDPQWVAPAAYNAGNAQYQLGAGTESSNPQSTIKSWTQALVDYRRAMVADPNDTDAKFNHELVSRKLAELRKKLEEQKQKQDEEKQKQDEEKDQEQKDQEQQDQQKQDDQKQDDQKQDQGEQQQDKPQDQQQQDQQQGDQKQDQQQQQEDQQQQAKKPEQPQDKGKQDQQPPQQPGQEQQAQQPEASDQQAAGGAAGERAPDSPEAKAAQAVIDTARGEELNPMDIDRPTGVAVSGEPSRDW